MENDKIQLREFFPNTSIGGELFGANYCGENQFVKIFYQEIDKPYTNESLNEINEFLSKNGYGYSDEDRLKLEDFNTEGHIYKEFPISISPDAYQADQTILSIQKDICALPQVDFLTQLLLRKKETSSVSNLNSQNDYANALADNSEKLKEIVSSGEKLQLKKTIADILSLALLIADENKLNVEEIILENTLKLPNNK
jgi:hypothetical protein